MIGGNDLLLGLDRERAGLLEFEARLTARLPATTDDCFDGARRTAVGRHFQFGVIECSRWTFNFDGSGCHRLKKRADVKFQIEAVHSGA
jgi:hypothetical protein